MVKVLLEEYIIFSLCLWLFTPSILRCTLGKDELLPLPQILRFISGRREMEMLLLIYMSMVALFLMRKLCLQSWQREDEQCLFSEEINLG
jgi:hypothetical protein